MSLYERIHRGEFKNVVVLTGAGISTAAGIPDYRSMAGLFTSTPQEMFVRKNAATLLAKVKETIDGAHERFDLCAPEYKFYHFCSWLQHQNVLRRVYTQNIDGLHLRALIGPSRDGASVVQEFHGNYQTDVVFYGEGIPESVIAQTLEDFDPRHPDGPVDLLIVAGTSLQVAPFCGLANLVPKTCCRVLISLTPEDAYYNEWTPRPDRLDYGFSRKMSISAMEKKRNMDLESHWRGALKLTSVHGLPQTRREHPRWKDQYVFEMGANEWATEILASEEPTVSTVEE